MVGPLEIILFFAFVAVVGVLFVGWVAFAILRLILNGLAAVIAPRPRLRGPTGTLMAHTVRCPTNGCLAINPSDARFCRRCGRGLPAAHRAPVRRAAVW